MTTFAQPTTRFQSRSTQRPQRSAASQDRTARTRELFALALTKASLGYDVTTGHDFLSYAVPTIRGELRKHFRDHGWMIRPPRRIQELQARISVAESELSNKLGRSPQPAEIAEHLDEPIESVIEALASD